MPEHNKIRAVARSGARAERTGVLHRFISLPATGQKRTSASEGQAIHARKQASQGR